MTSRIDKALVARSLVATRSQAENYIKLGLVMVNNKVVNKPGYIVDDADKITVEGEQYVSRAALKLASISKQFELDFRDKTVLDVGSSTGGFTDYSLQHGAKKVIAVDVGTDQLHPRLRVDSRVELYEKTDIRDVRTTKAVSNEQRAEKSPVQVTLSDQIDVVVADVSFISLRLILPHVSTLTSHSSILVAMCKPQFEAGKDQTNKGIIKNSAMRRQILKDFETWLIQNGFMILDKADSHVSGTKGNIERFYKLKVKK